MHGIAQTEGGGFEAQQAKSGRDGGSPAVGVSCEKQKDLSV